MGAYGVRASDSGRFGPPGRNAQIDTRGHQAGRRGTGWGSGARGDHANASTLAAPLLQVVANVDHLLLCDSQRFLGTPGPLSPLNGGFWVLRPGVGRGWAEGAAERVREGSANRQGMTIAPCPQPVRRGGACTTGTRGTDPGRLHARSPVAASCGPLLQLFERARAVPAAQRQGSGLRSGGTVALLCRRPSCARS